MNHMHIHTLTVTVLDIHPLSLNLHTLILSNSKPKITWNNAFSVSNQNVKTLKFKKKSLNKLNKHTARVSYSTFLHSSLFSFHHRVSVLWFRRVLRRPTPLTCPCSTCSDVLLCAAVMSLESDGVRQGVPRCPVPRLRDKMYARNLRRLRVTVK